MTSTASELSSERARKLAWRFVWLLGVVSLLGDVTYEGARSITGPYLALFGASAVAVGFIAGFGELIGYGLRLASGIISDRTQRYWAITITGYAVNLLAVPLLALAGSWQIAAVLLIVERTGKAIRTPARDAMLSHAANEVGSGRAFGVHEAMDQTGAVLGPLIVAAVIATNGGYRAGFAVLLVPALLALSVLLVARWRYPRPSELEIKIQTPSSQGLDKRFWLYLAAVALVAAGYADFPLIAYHFEKSSVLGPSWIPIFYSVAMGVDALAALGFGYLYDRAGIIILAGAAALSAFFAPLVFLGGSQLALLGVALWGIGTGAQESIMRAVVGQLAPVERRGSAYGLFNAGFGLSWFLGSVALGALYDWSLPAVVVVSMLLQLASIPLFLRLRQIWQ